MRRLAFRLLLLLLAFGLYTKQADAFTLGYPDISFDSSQGAGGDLFGAQGVVFDATTGYLSVSAKALSISYDGVTSTNLASGTIDYRVQLSAQSANPSVVTGNFVSSGASPADLVIMDGSTTLLTGNFSSYTLSGFVGSSYGAGIASFVVTGGTLASFFGGNGGAGGVVNLDFNISPQFSASSFLANFSGSVKGDVAPIVPIPSGMLLMGSGLILFTLFRGRGIGEMIYR